LRVCCSETCFKKLWFNGHYLSCKIEQSCKQRDKSENNMADMLERDVLYIARTNTTCGNCLKDTKVPKLCGGCGFV